MSASNDAKLKRRYKTERAVSLITPRVTNLIKRVVDRIHYEHEFPLQSRNFPSFLYSFRLPRKQSFVTTRMISPLNEDSRLINFSTKAGKRRFYPA